ncbi:unnamed protein product [Cylindrotheca closterium]|uniref:Aromatic amino acid beta-eliminating lyase/threonine aldolase domain-containing protein n=1 Tax=Cylindrotheca closterium TaxID=2856 RepID=A0AAD2CS68_9STRA|nr:unnamed protein product [Cylindrotheca closterium]
MFLLKLLLCLLLPTNANTIRLQTPHPLLSPSESMHQIATECDKLDVGTPDLYGDFHLENSFLRQFEADLAEEFGKEDAVFLPSGVMAQQIALLVHSKEKKKTSFLCHKTSHLLIHEKEGYSELCGLHAVDLPLTEQKMGISGPPLLYDHLLEAELDDICTLIIELPHRELGGKLTPWSDIMQMQHLMKEKDISFHCDGARIFEASVGYKKSVRELASPFESIYFSFYKGLASPYGGAMLMGTNSFCEEARIWLRRFGGNLYSLLPYIVAGKAGYLKYVKDQSHPTLSFGDKHQKLLRITDSIQKKGFETVGCFEPEVPEVNMVHCFLRLSSKDCIGIRDEIEDKSGVSIFHRISELKEGDKGWDEGYRCKFELYMGQANGSIEDEIWVNTWSDFIHLASDKK